MAKGNILGKLSALVVGTLVARRSWDVFFIGGSQGGEAFFLEFIASHQLARIEFAHPNVLLLVRFGDRRKINRRKNLLEPEEALIEIEHRDQVEIVLARIDK